MQKKGDADLVLDQDTQQRTAVRDELADLDFRVGHVRSVFFVR